jgi:hypothetical protein
MAICAGPVTGDRWAVDQASNDSGRLGEIWGQEKARNVIDALSLRRERVQHGANELWRRCLSEHVTAIDDQGRLIPATDWLHLNIILRIENMLWVVRRGVSSTVPAYKSVLFLRAGAEVLRKFPPEVQAEIQNATTVPVEATRLEPRVLVKQK